VETDNCGIIGLQDERKVINAMKEYYRTEYRNLLNKERKLDWDLFCNKWKVRFGFFATRIGLTFSTKGFTRAISKAGTIVVSRLTERIMKWKNKRDKAKLKKQKDQLTADFINMDGNFKQFSIINPTTIESIEEIEEKRFQR